MIDSSLNAIFENPSSSGNTPKMILCNGATLANTLTCSPLVLEYRNDFEEKNVSIQLPKFVRQARTFAESSLDRFSHEFLYELTYIAEPISKLYPSIDEETAITKIWELCSRHGGEINKALKRIQALHDEPYQKRQVDSLLAIMAEQPYLKEPVAGLIDVIFGRLVKAIPTLFQHNAPINEQDLNDKIQSIIETDRYDYEREYPGNRFALATAIPDHSFNNLNLMIETKYVRGITTPAKVTEGIAVHITKYGSSDYTILFIVYDPNRAIKDDYKFSNDFEKTGKCKIKIFG